MKKVMHFTCKVWWPMRKLFDHGLSFCVTSLTCTVQHMTHIEQDRKFLVQLKIIKIEIFVGGLKKENKKMK